MTTAAAAAALSDSDLDSAYSVAMQGGDTAAALIYADEIIRRQTSLWETALGGLGINRFPLYSEMTGVSQTSIQGDLASSAQKVGHSIASGAKNILGNLSIGAGAIIAVVVLLGLGYIWLRAKK